MSNFQRSVVFAVCMAVTRDAFAQDTTCQRPAESVTEMGLQFEPGLVLNRLALRRTLTPPFDSDQARYYMLQIAYDGPPQNGWQLHIRDARSRLLKVIEPADLADAPVSGRWTERIVASQLQFELHLDDQASHVKLRIVDSIIMKSSTPNPRYSRMGNVATYRPLHGELENFEGTTEDMARVRRLGDRIGMVVGRGLGPGGKATNWCCSGVLLTGDLFLTNWHCGAPHGAPDQAFWHEDHRRGSLVDMSWDGDAVSRDLTFGTREAFDRDLDYTVLRLQGTLGGRIFANSGRRLEIASTAASPGTGQIRIIHHAECRPKMISYNCRVTNAERRNWKNSDSAGQSDFTHDCDTEGGSSGAPVFDSRGALIGLHHLGFEAIAQGQCDRQNKAVHIHRIFEHIKSQNPTLHNEIRAGTSTAPAQ